ncbi:MAG: type II toxin-antitoxin system RelB/DinJ family antitoxin [Prevotella sp.]|jgi:DNA-damage-inducible protein J|nr:type II toxin-antitoxin system RelB/DinJ family antitoxin [Prevotella sp.]
MAQLAMTVRMDSNVKKQFDQLCQQFGMSANTAINIFVNQVIRSRSIPFVISATDDATERAEVRQEALNAFQAARMQAEVNEDNELSLDDINREIKATRKMAK